MKRAILRVVLSGGCDGRLLPPRLSGMRAFAQSSHLSRPSVASRHIVSSLGDGTHAWRPERRAPLEKGSRPAIIRAASGTGVEHYLRRYTVSVQL